MNTYRRRFARRIYDKDEESQIQVIKQATLIEKQNRISPFKPYRERKRQKRESGVKTGLDKEGLGTALTEI